MKLAGIKGTRAIKNTGDTGGHRRHAGIKTLNFLPLAQEAPQGATTPPFKAGASASTR